MFGFLRSLIYIMELKCLNLMFLIYLAKITNFLYAFSLCQFCLQYKTIQRFCKTCHSKYEIQSKKPNILFMPDQGRISEICV